MGRECGKNLHCDKQPMGLSIHCLVRPSRERCTAQEKEMHSTGQFTYDTIFVDLSTQNRANFLKQKNTLQLDLRISMKVSY